MFKTYYVLTKPGIVYGNAVNIIAGYLLAAATARSFVLARFVAVLVGLSLVIGAGCVCNNYIDRDIDKKMARTKKRALALGTISVQNAFIFAAILGVAGFATLVLWTNLLTVVIAAVGFIDYVIIYGYYKRRSVHGTLVGSISGATPPLAGFTASSGHLGTEAFLLFLIMALWQMPHFYAIAIYRLKDYANAGIPVWSVKKGVASAKKQIVGYTLAFLIASLLMSIFGYTGYIYFVVMAIVGGVWFWLAVQGLNVSQTATDKWARKLFFFSLVITLVVAIMLPLGALLP